MNTEAKPVVPPATASETNATEVGGSELQHPGASPASGRRESDHISAARFAQLYNEGWKDIYDL